MKKLIYIAIVVFTSNVFVSCEDRLNLTDPSALGVDNFIFDGVTAQRALFEAYNDMQSRYVVNSEMRMVQGLYADELAHPGSFPDLDEALVNNFQSINLSVTRIFSNHYDIINTATEVIRGTEALDVTAIDPAVQAEIIAEAHALRAYAYFQLVKVFGGLPIVETTVPFDGPDAYNTPRSSQSEVYAYILSEIALAEGRLPSSNPITQFTNDAVKVLKADVLLFTGDYPEAEAALSSLIGAYSLTDTFDEVFALNALENSTAIMRVNLNSADGGDLQTFFTPGGRREVSPSVALVNAFEAGDERLGLISNPNDPTTNFINKFQSNTSYFPYVYRYEDVLLMYAEVLARRNSPDALQYIDAIRTRAGLGSAGSLNSSNVVEKIAQERRVEFYGEAKRWEDVKRYGLAPAVINSKTGVTFTERQLLWPIPQDELDRNALINQADQNPGY